MANLYKKKTWEIDPKTGLRKRKVSRKWWARYRDALGCDRRVALCGDKAAAQAMLSTIIQKVERRRAGIEDPIQDEVERPIEKHLVDFENHLKSRNNTERYIFEILGKIRRFIKTQYWRTILDITASDVQSQLVHFREHNGLSIQTSNHYLRAIKSFTRWLVLNQRLRTNPLDSLSMLNVNVDRRHDRRPLLPEEFLRLIDLAEHGPPAVGLSGRDRAMMYILAAWTGFRRGEIGSLTLRSFNLNSSPPTVTVEAAYSKHRREDIQVLHPDIVKRFRVWLEHRKPEPDEILFHICERNCGIDRRTSEMMRIDLRAARNLWIQEAENAEERLEREKSDFLKYKDSRGKYADFHSLRHTFVTNLCRADISPKTAQMLARHSDIRLTMNVYSHVDQQEQAAAINSMPGLG